jgi:hypothetical protein
VHVRWAIALHYRDGDTWHIPALLYFQNEGINLVRQGTQLAPLTANMTRVTLHAKLALRSLFWVMSNRPSAP